MDLKQIDKFLEINNIAGLLDKETLDKIGSRVVSEYELDRNSRSEWESSMEEACKLATQIVEKKNSPFENAANIKYPLLATAAIQFGARALPNIIGPIGPVKCKVLGKDPEGKKAARGTRVSEHMNYQLLNKMEDWEDDTDSLLSALAIEGAEFRKIYYDMDIRYPASIIVRPMDLVVHYTTRNLAKCPRVTHMFELYPYEIDERKRAGLFLYGAEELGNATETLIGKEAPVGDDTERPHLFLEQHRYWDIDGDGYREPYIVTVHKDSGKVVRIVARFEAEGVKIDSRGRVIKIEAINYFNHYRFMHSIDGSVYGLGFGTLLGPINRVISTLINQILDAGTLDNAGGGFLGTAVNFGPQRTGGPIKFKLGEWKPITFPGDDIRKQVLPKPKIEPSQVLFALLGAMIESGEKLGSTSEVMEGKTPGTRTPAASVFALIEQGLKVFGSIHKRLHRSFKKEYKRLHKINSMYPNEAEYKLLHDLGEVSMRADYQATDLDILPVSDPNDVSDSQKILKAQTLMAMQGQGFNDHAIKRRFLEAMRVPDIDEILPKKAAPPVDPKLQFELQKLELERDRFNMELLETKFKVMEVQARAVKALAQAQEVLERGEIETAKSRMSVLGDLLGKAMESDTKIQVEKMKGSRDAEKRANKNSS